MSNAHELIWPAADYSRVPYQVFLDQDVYEQEQNKVFQGPVWLFLAFEAEIPNPGDFKTTYAGDCPVVVNRAEDGSLHAFVNSCAHRGTMVVRHRKGNAQSHTCVYHRWGYNLEGDLIHVPFQHGIQGKGGLPENFDKGKHGLRKLKVASYRGVIFGSFDPNVEDLEEFLDEPVVGFLDRMFSKPIQILGHRRQRFPNNWKLYYENYGDGYHAGLLHQLAVKVGLLRSSQAGARIPDKLGRHSVAILYAGSDTAEIIDEGGEIIEEDSGESELAMQFTDALKLEDMSCFAWRDEVGDGQAVRVSNVFPNCRFAQVRNVFEAEQIRPKSATELEVYWTYFGYADDDPELRQKRFQQANMVGPAGYNNMEDGEVGILTQRGIHRRGDEHSLIEMGGGGEIVAEDHIVSEMTVRGFWRHYCHLMGYELNGGSNRPQVGG